MPDTPVLPRPYNPNNPARDFFYGNPVEPPEPPPPGHRGAYAGQWRQTVVCQTCGMICYPDREDGAYVDGDTAMGRDDADTLPHRYPFDRDPRTVQGVAETMRDDDPAPVPPDPDDWEPDRYVLCREVEGCKEWAGHPWPHSPAQNALGAARTPPAQRSAPALVIGTPDPEIERASRLARRRANRPDWIAPDAPIVKYSKNYLTPEYRRVQKRRERARKAGVSEDVILTHPNYRLPKRGDESRVERLKRRLVRTGLIARNDLDQYPVAELAHLAEDEGR